MRAPAETAAPHSLIRAVFDRVDALGTHHPRPAPIEGAGLQIGVLIQALPDDRRVVRGNRGVNQLVAGACPARRRFSVYFLVYETQKEDGACASHLASSVSCWNRSSGVNSTRWWRVTPAMPTSNRL